MEIKQLSTSLSSLDPRNSSDDSTELFKMTTALSRWGFTTSLLTHLSNLQLKSLFTAIVDEHISVDLSGVELPERDKQTLKRVAPSILRYDQDARTNLETIRPLDR